MCLVLFIDRPRVSRERLVQPDASLLHKPEIQNKLKGCESHLFTKLCTEARLKINS